MNGMVLRHVENVRRITQNDRTKKQTASLVTLRNTAETNVTTVIT